MLGQSLPPEQFDREFTSHSLPQSERNVGKGLLSYQSVKVFDWNLVSVHQQSFKYVQLLCPSTTLKMHPRQMTLCKVSNFGIPYEFSQMYIYHTEFPVDSILKNVEYSISSSKMFIQLISPTFCQMCEQETASLLTQVELRLDGLTVHLDAATQHVTCGSDDPVEVDLSPGISVLVTNNM